jgi:hypothetical protein
MTASADLRKIPAPTPKSKLSPAPKRTPAYTDDEPEVVVRHFNTQRSTRAANTPKGDGVKRFSDLD